MGATFGDITLYNPTPFERGTPEYEDETSLINFVCDLYVQKMHGYKPPQATRVTLQPHYHNIWDRTWKNGSIFSIAPLFDRKNYESLDKKGKYQYILDIVQDSMLQLGEEYQWDNVVFRRTYKEIINKEFSFFIDYPEKASKDKKKRAKLVLEKTEVLSTLYAVIKTKDKSIKCKLFDKRNWYWYDSIYQIAKHNRWIDNNRFGILMKDLNFSVWYSVVDDKVLFEVNGKVKEQYNLEKMFTL